MERERTELEIVSPLRDCIAACETVCVVGCCGLDAFDVSPKVVGDWRAMSSADAVSVASGQVELLIETMGASPTHLFATPLLNWATVDDGARRRLLEFLVKLRDALAVA